jgi:hypothetical protein
MLAQINIANNHNQPAFMYKILLIRTEFPWTSHKFDGQFSRNTLRTVTIRLSKETLNET